MKIYLHLDTVHVNTLVMTQLPSSGTASESFDSYPDDSSQQAYIGLLQTSSECPDAKSVLLEVSVAVEQLLNCPAAYRQLQVT